MSKKFIIQLWVALLVMLFVSLAIGELASPFIATLAVFGVAIIKAFIVLYYYMGMKEEPKFLIWSMAGATVLMIMLFFILWPDIVAVYGKM